MAVKKKIERIDVNPEARDSFINKGQVVPVDRQKGKREYHAFELRIPIKFNSMIDMDLEVNPTMSKHAWILDAICQKLRNISL